jgi:hypothetical protein
MDVAGQTDAKAILESRGLIVQDYLGDEVYVVHNASGPASLQTINGVIAVAAYTAAYKVHAELLRSGSSVFDALVQFYPSPSANEYAALIQASGGLVQDRKLAVVGAIEAKLSAAAARALAASPLVRHIGLAPKDEPLNFDTRSLTGANVLQRSSSNGGGGLLGAGVVVGVGDDIAASFHIDTRERAINFTPSPLTSPHGSHVTGTIGATGIIDPFGRGIAPRATFLNHYFNQVWAQTVPMRTGYGMTLTNNSYKSGPHRCDYNGTYDLNASLLDGLSQTAPDVLHVFASGNDGLDSCPPFPKHYSSLPGGYQAAKNVVVVGNILKHKTDISLSSSRGPTKDGRLKPDICALGDAIWSTVPNNDYGMSWGTSMAAPAVTGGLALLTERYRALNSGANPPAALLRAYLLNGASDRGLAGPDFTYGFGSMNLLHSLAMVDSSRQFSGSLANGSSQTFSIQVPAGLAQLKVMLCYDDRAALPGTAKALINDLDLEVSGAAGVRLPLVANPAPASVMTPAAEAADHRNNVEQVTITTPAAGTYTVTVKGFSVPMGPQAFHVAYDFVQPGIRFLQPSAGVPLIAGYNHKLYWDAVDTTGTFLLEYSSNGGSTWNTIANNLPGSRRAQDWTVPSSISGGQCLVRITRSAPAESATSEVFGANPIPSISLAPVQCPGYIAIQWSAVANATGYEVTRKIGYDMEPVDTVTTTSFVFSGLSPDSTYYVAARPLFGNVPGYRTYGLTRRPSDGNCAGPISDGDLTVRRIVSPQTGRVGTTSALSASQPVQILVRNLDDAPSSPFTVAYRLNGGAWIPQTVTTPIPALDSAVITFPAVNLSAPGMYVFQTAVQGAAADPVRNNDSLTLVVRQLANAPVNLATGITEDFESAPSFTIQRDTLGFTPTERWDFFRSNSLGRIRSTVSPDILISGSRSLSMDATATNSGTQNFLQGTFNLAGYSAATDEVRMEARYRLHGTPKFVAGNEVQVRSADGAAWTTVARYDTTAESGDVLSTGSVSLTDAVLATAGAFSSSSAIRFGQRDTSVIGGRSFGNGLTVDDVKLYTVQNDVQLVSVVSPARVTCGLGNATTLQVAVYNGVQQTQSNVQLFYRLDSGAVQTATLPSIPGKDTVTFSFPQPFNASAPGAHRLSIWLSATGDTYRANDSILNYVFRNQPLIASYPYLENFERGDGAFYAEGRNSSWGYGTPSGMLVKNAASGTKAWKTGLAGQYNDREQSSLCTPCFDYSGLASPMLSFSAAVDIENCTDNYLCDVAMVEWSSDAGRTWQVLGDSGQGFNWYNSNVFNGWTVEGFTRWHVASIPLPQGVPMPVRLRFTVKSDGGETREGLAIDDVHVFDRTAPLYDGGSSGPIVRTVAAGSAAAFTQSGGITAVVDGQGSSLGTTEVQTYTHPAFVDSSTVRYYLPRSFTVKPEMQPADSARVRLFVSDDEVETMLQETSCPECSRAADVYRLGMTKYDSPVESEENGSLSDNRTGLYNFYPYSQLAWVPYERGYYAEAMVKGFSEFWFFDDGPSVSYPPADAAVSLTAVRTTATQVQLEWISKVDSTAVQYELQRAINSGGAFETILTKAGLGAGNAQTTYDDAPPAQTGDTVQYRVKWRTLDGTQFFTSVRRVPWTAANIIASIYPNPTSEGVVHIRWSSDPTGELAVVVTDAVGRIVYRATKSPNAFDNETSIPMPVATGMYYLKATLAGKKYGEKIIVR